MGLKIETEKITLNQWFEQWMSLYMITRLKKTTISNYLNSYRRCEEYIGYMKLKDIQMTNIQYMINDLYKKGYTISTIKSSVSVIYSCLEKAVTLRILFNFEKGYIDVYKTLNRTPISYDEHGNKLEEHYYTVQITTPKKAASVRKVPLLKVVADALESWREKQNADKRKLKKKWGVNNSLLKDYPELIFTTQYGNYYLSTQAERECKRITSIMNRREEKMH